MLKLNLGSGHNKIEGYINVDRSSECGPDVCVNLEIGGAWPWMSNDISHAAFIHSLEHMGQDFETFSWIMRELYRVCAHDAEIIIVVPHPRHDDFLNDPTHVRAITPEIMQLFSKRFNRECKEKKASNTTLGLYLDIDFETVRTDAILAEPYFTQFHAGKITQQQVIDFAANRNNVIKEYHILMRCVK